MRRGQLQTLEPILIVIVLVVIIGLVLLFTIRIGKVDAGKAQSRISTEEDFATLQRIVDLPELSCSRAVSAKDYCIDLYKAKAFEAHSDTLYYYPFFGASNITLTYIDLNSGQESLHLYSNAHSDNIRETRTFFTIYDPVTNQEDFAVLTVEREQ